MKKNTLRNVVIACLIVAVSGGLIHFSGLADLGVKSSDCEGNGTCGMKYFKAIRDAKFAEENQ